MSVVVGVALETEALRQRWIAELVPLLEDCEVVDAETRPAEDIEVAVVGNPPGRSLERFPSLRFAQSTWAGVEHLAEDLPLIPVARMAAPEFSLLMTEMTLTAVLMLHRHIPAYRRQQQAAEWRPHPVRPASERRVGVLGFGELGRPAALRLASSGFQVKAWARSRRDDEVEVLTGESGWERLLGESDVVVNLLPLTPATRGILDREAFELMPEGAALVNLARGGHVVEPDLLTALDTGRLSDAVLDVFIEEPLPESHPFWTHARVTVLPHIAAPSNPSQLAPHVAANIRRFLDGDEPRFLVRP
ncbi:MAG TPA: glyoxylate/hydroxypyruvate reductase A [Acidimicrobiia bacterium]|nr:glyoxylate/hydroxypyruvate reductase A [Acidimicrobiia bacterium]